MRLLALIALLSPLRWPPDWLGQSIGSFWRQSFGQRQRRDLCRFHGHPVPSTIEWSLVDRSTGRQIIPARSAAVSRRNGWHKLCGRDRQTGSNGLSGVSDQLAAFAATHPGGAPADALYTLWAGANDIFNGGNPVLAADNIFNNILSLAAGGGKYFLWLNLPDLGLTPRAVAAGQTIPANLASAAFNAEWTVDLGKLQALGINVTGVNVQALFTQIVANPGAFGFSNVTGPGQGQANPNSYLFWDDEHPTTAGHALVANLAFTDLSVPEPASVAFAALGLLSLVLWKRRAKQA